MARVALDVPAPDFELADHQGGRFSLGSRRGMSNVLLVFNRGFT